MAKNSDIDFSALDSKEKILENIVALKNELQGLKLKVSFGYSGGGMKIRKIRKDVARLFTKLNSLK